MIVQKKTHQSLVIELSSVSWGVKQDDYVYFIAPRSLIGNKQTWHFQL